MDSLNRPARQPHTRISADKLASLIAGLGADEKRVLRLLDDFHFAYGSHVQRLYFTKGGHEAMTRARNRMLSRLTNEKILYRYPRRRLSGGIPAGHIYALDHAGQRIMNYIREAERPSRSLALTTNHFEHALEVTELHIQFSELARNGSVKVLESHAEPACHIRFGSHRILKPDYYVKYHRTTKEGRVFEDEWFVEVERSRQSATATLAKVNGYRKYMGHLKDDQVMPRILFICYDEAHRAYIERLLDRDTDRDLFMVALNDTALQAMIGAE